MAMDINFHIGAPRVGSEYVHAAAAASSFKKHRGVLLLPPDTYRNQFRTLINTKDSYNLMESDWENTIAQIRSYSVHDTVAISQHAALGTQGNLIFSKRGLDRATTRITTISSLFSDYELTFHLAITCQVDYLFSTLGRDATATLASSHTFSWSDIVGHLKAAVPNRKFVVWDFERPRDVALAFVSEILNVFDDAFINEVRPLLRLSHLPQANLHTQNPVDELDDSLLQLDIQYESDLNSILRMEGVSLVSGDSVPTHFKI